MIREDLPEFLHKDEKDMSMLSSVATLLESTAAALRRADGRRTPKAIVAPVQALLDMMKPDQHPLGYWLCTHSTFDDFVVGLAYHCRQNERRSGARIYPYHDSYWSPYWVSEQKRFCYGPADLQFTYIGPGVPKREMLDTRTYAQRVAARHAARLASRKIPIAA